MTQPPLQPGLRHQQRLWIDAGLTVPAVSSAFTGFRDMPPVFATAFLVGFVEWTCIEALRPFLAPGQRSVGVHVDLSHSAPTPVGQHVSAAVELVAVHGRRLRFEVVCRDASEVICEGRHERVIVELDRFLQRLSVKQGRRPGPT
jgi:fluoroacetyl-CoA thioesterase